MPPNRIGWERDAAGVETIFTTELDSMGDGDLVVTSSAHVNSVDDLTHAMYELAVNFGAAPDAGLFFHLHLLWSLDGSTFEDGSSTVTPNPQSRVGSFPVRNVATAKVILLRDIPIPPEDYHLLLINNTGQATPSSGSTLRQLKYQKEVKA